MKKRLLIVTLILTLIMNQGVSYGLPTNPGEDENLEYAQKLKKVGVFVGSDEGFELDRTASRLEGIIMLIRLLGVEEEALNTYYDIPFTDVPDWAFGYVSYAYNYSLSNGISATKFGSNDELTSQQYFTFMARALEYDDSEGDFNWRDSIEFLYEKKLIKYDEINEYKQNKLLRSDLAKLSYDLMSRPMNYSRKTLADYLIDEESIDLALASEIGIYTPLQTTKDVSAILSPNSLSADYNQVSIDRMVEQGYPSPYAVPKTVEATSSDEYVITFTNGLTGQALFDSLNHKGFSEIAVDFDEVTISSFDLGDSLSLSETPYTLSASLKGKNFYEFKYYDEFEQYASYYKSDDKVHYNVAYVLLGNYSDPIEELSKSITGQKVYMQPFKIEDYPSYNPLIITSQETLNYITFTELNGETVLYLEKESQFDLFQQWISLKSGLVIQQYVYDDDGIIRKIKELKRLSYEAISDSTFDQPDIEYMDFTTLLYGLHYNNLESIQKALIGSFKEEAFSCDLVVDSQTKYTLHVDGYDGGDDLGSFAYISYANDSLGNLIEVRQLYDGDLFHTITPEFLIDQVYEGSKDRLMMFEFDELSIRDFSTEDNIEVYTFQDTSYGVLNGLAQFFDYRINTETNKIESITQYFKDGPLASERIQETIYTIENFGEFDETLFEVTDDYQVITNPNEKYYDGEFPYFWYYYNQENMN